VLPISIEDKVDSRIDVFIPNTPVMGNYDLPIARIVADEIVTFSRKGIEPNDVCRWVVANKLEMNGRGSAL
jgi:hypothetical protein